MNVAELDRAFMLDTNVFLYAFDKSAPDKQAASRDLIAHARKSGLGMISAQVLQEFLHASLRKGKAVFTRQDAADYLRIVLAPLCKVHTTPGLLEFTFEVQEETGYSFYDSLILTAAIQSQCHWLLTEDLQHGRKVRGVKILNPYL